MCSSDLPSTTKGKSEADIEELEDESTLMEADR